MDRDELSSILESIRSAPSSSKAPDGGIEALREALSHAGLAKQDAAAKSAYSREELVEQLKDKLLTPQASLQGEELVKRQVHWHRKPDFSSLLPAQPLPQTTSLRFIRTGLGSNVIGTKEVVTHQPPSTSQAARKARLEAQKVNASQRKGMSFVRGRSGGAMFMPGGLDDDDLLIESIQGERVDQEQGIERDVEEVEEAIKGWGRGMRTKAPGLSRGFKAATDEDEDEEEVETGAEMDIAKSLVPAPVYQPSLKASLRVGGSAADAPQQRNSQLDEELDELLPTEKPPTHSSRRAAKVDLEEKTEWAHVLDASKRLANFNDLVPDMAHKFPFTLDPFQQEAVYHLEQGDDVFVAAHTSAGKTVVAEYAVALAQRHMTRCIYTSPIKALSNQKFRDFKQTFGAENVGILTGDVQINSEAPCLIMTTEILRSMLYRGADLIRDVEFVIFDEVHYVNDQERGVVWEEVIILLPRHISIILLSATVPNTKEFADWVGRTKKKDIYVISTSKRPVPLEHFLYANKDLFKIVGADGKFAERGIKDAGDALKRKQDKEREAAGVAQPTRQGARGGAAGGANSNSRGGRGSFGPQRGGARGGRGGGASSVARTIGGDTKNLWVHLTGMLKKKDLLPVVVFVFSKRRCEEYASSLPNTDFCSAKDKSEVHVVIERSIMRLKGPDRTLPQIQRMRELLARGIAVHHGGLLPIVKEIVELLFQRGLVKVLFATETFAMGVNMPARSVVFSGIRKHDGHGFRDLLAGEYTQMSGRAGRRGLDATGVVIINSADQLPETTTLHKMLLGQPTKLQSQFRLTYNMILNLLRVETLKVEEMIKRSFSENASQRLLPDQQKKAAEARKKLDRLPQVSPPERADELSQYYDAAWAAFMSNHSVLDLALEQQQGSRIFAPGRVVLLRDAHFDHNPAVIVKQVSSREFLVLGAVTQQRKEGRLDVPDKAVPPIWPPQMKRDAGDELVYDLREVPLTSFAFISAHVLKIEQSMIMAHRKSAMNRTVDLMREPIAELRVELREVDWTKMRRLDFQEALKSRDERGAIAVAHLVDTTLPDFDKQYRLTHARKQLEKEVARIEHSMSNQNLELLPDYEQRVGVLKTLRFIDPLTESVLLKGRVACEINSADELVLTELILDNVFAGYEAEEIVALLSVFVFKERTDGAEEEEFPPRLSEGLATILGTAERVSQVQAEHQLNYDDYAVSLKTGLVNVVYQWARGRSFGEIMEMTEVAEGTIVRVMTRLDQTCLEVRDAARVVGDQGLREKMEEAQQMITRDILAAPSLYI
ncbi:putative SKI2-antiviral protein and putative helicase [Jaminaea rosea]|uniref:Putative SKI2-antiviral protein and putative helicase n=1 Tax=Jaminaea rosea TaxID=1569628 RepID=A0A316V1V5_9BASI|nr:putative SKI2-antiviral protein and putative helicase [Jaminaea rosea]PWN30163.1 putative SKI2-antiviral protein and putative helicase [Jaminaea rosea]